MMYYGDLEISAPDLHARIPCSNPELGMGLCSEDIALIFAPEWVQITKFVRVNLDQKIKALKNHYDAEDRSPFDVGHICLLCDCLGVSVLSSISKNKHTLFFIIQNEFFGLPCNENWQFSIALRSLERAIASLLLAD